MAEYDADRIAAMTSAIRELRDAAAVLRAQHTPDVNAIAAEADEHLERAVFDLGSVKHPALNGVQRIRGLLKADVTSQSKLDGHASSCSRAAEGLATNLAPAQGQTSRSEALGAGEPALSDQMARARQSNARERPPESARPRGGADSGSPPDAATLQALKIAAANEGRPARDAVTSEHVAAASGDPRVNDPQKARGASDASRRGDLER